MRRARRMTLQLPAALPPKPTYPQYDQVEALARQLTPQFVDPANLHPERHIMAERGDDWCTAVLGRPAYPGVWMSVHEQYLLIAAHRLNIDPPLPDEIVEARRRADERKAEQERRIAAAHQRDRDAWAAALAGVVVDLDVYAGTHARVRGALHEPIGHAVPRVDVYSGPAGRVRVHRAGHGLCETPGRPRPLGLNWRPESADIPATCDRCLAWTPKVRGTEQP